MKGLDALPNSKETISKFIYNLKKPNKNKILAEEYDTFDIKENHYACLPQIPDVYDNIYAAKQIDATSTDEDDSLYFSFENLSEICDDDNDAVINIKPRYRILHSISEVSLYSNESINSVTSSPPRDVFEKEPALEQYLRPDELNSNYAHIDATVLLNQVEAMKTAKPINRGRLGSTPTIVHHSREFVDAKHHESCILSNNKTNSKNNSTHACRCVMLDKVKRSQSVDGICFSHTRNSSSYNKFKNKVRNNTPTSGFAKYIEINGVEYKVPSNVPKHDPPDLVPPPALPPKKSQSNHDIRKAVIEQKINNDETLSELFKLNRSGSSSSIGTAKDFDIVDRLEELVNMIKDLQSNEIQAVIECPTYVKDSSYIDNIRRKRRKRLFTRDRLQSCPSPSTDTDERVEANIERLGSCKSVPIVYDDKNEKMNIDFNRYTPKNDSSLDAIKSDSKNENPNIAFNCYTLKNDTSSLEVIKSSNDLSDYNLFVATKINKNDNGYTTPFNTYQPTEASPCSTDSNGYVYAHPADRKLSDKMDYQYAYCHTQHPLHLKAKRNGPVQTTKSSPFHLNSSNLCDVTHSSNSCDITHSKHCSPYANIKCFETIPESRVTCNVVKNTRNEYLLSEPPYRNLCSKDAYMNKLKSHDYVLVNPVSEPGTKGESYRIENTRQQDKQTDLLDKKSLFQGPLAKYLDIGGKEYMVPTSTQEYLPPDSLDDIPSVVKYENNVSFLIKEIEKSITVN